MWSTSTKEDAVAAVQRITGGKGVQYVLECSGAPNALNEAARMVNRGGRICLAAFPAEPVPVDLAYLVRNNIYVFGIRGEGKSATHRAAALMAQKRFDAKLIHTHTFPLAEVPTAHQLRPRARRGRDQGGREDVRKLSRTSPCRRAPKCRSLEAVSNFYQASRLSFERKASAPRGCLPRAKSRRAPSRLFGNCHCGTRRLNRPASAVTFIATCVKGGVQ